jgi:hypothetical protein
MFTFPSFFNWKKGDSAKDRNTLPKSSSSDDEFHDAVESLEMIHDPTQQQVSDYDRDGDDVVVVQRE